MEKFFITFQDYCYFFKTDEDLKKIENKIHLIYEKYSFYFQQYNNNSIIVSHDKIFLLMIFDLLSESEKEQKNMNCITFDDNIININDQNRVFDLLLLEKIKEIHSFYKILLD